MSFSKKIQAHYVIAITEFKVGDKVKYSGKFLKSTGQYSKDVADDVGEVVRIEPVTKDRKLLYVKWKSNPAKEQGVLSVNVMLANKPDYSNM